MSRATNTLKTSDVTSVPIQVKYFASYNTVSPAPLWSNVGITYKRGLNYTGSLMEIIGYNQPLRQEHSMTILDIFQQLQMQVFGL